MSEPSPAPARPSRWRRIRRWTLWSGLVLVLGLMTISVVAWESASKLIVPRRNSVDTLPADLPTIEYTFSTNRDRIHGWFTPGKRGTGAVALFHGLHGDRRAMLRRVRFLHAAGFSSLAIDLQGHGESSGGKITFGFDEARGVHAALHHLRELCPGEPIGVIGVSLGGAACLLGHAPVTADCYILESVYPSMHHAIERRLGQRIGRWAAVLAAPLLTLQCKPRLGISAQRLRPLSVMPKLRAPVFVLGGELDENTPPRETRDMFVAAPEPKQLWIVPGARHRDLHQSMPAEYEKRVLAFLRAHLRR